MGLMNTVLENAPKESSSQKTKSVLIVDDDFEICDMMSYMVENLGMQVIVAINGYEAIEKYKQNMPDIVFMDVRMPEKDGCETLKEIEGFDRNANIVLLTAFSADKCIIELKKIQQVRIVEKPFEMTEIVSILKSM
jgi:CheY-like chemotaxis protein